MVNSKDVMINSEEASAVVFAAAALTYISENPNLYLAEWTTAAKTNKAAILLLANKVNQTADGLNEPESPAEVLRRLQLDSAAATLSHKRTATIHDRSLATSHNHPVREKFRRHGLR